MDAGVASSLAVSVVALVAAYLTYRNNRAGQTATDKIETRKLDRDEFDSLREELWAQLEGVKADLREEREMRVESDRRAEAAERRALAAEKRATEAEKRATEAQKNGAAATRKLAKRVEQLENLIRELGATVPPPLP